MVRSTRLVILIKNIYILLESETLPSTFYVLCVDSRMLFFSVYQ